MTGSQDARLDDGLSTPKIGRPVIPGLRRRGHRGRQR